MSPTITLEVPVAGTDIEAGLHATNYSDLQTLLNGGLDGSNFVNASLTLGASFALNIGGDTNLYRSAANELKTDDSFISGFDGVAQPAIRVPSLTAGGAAFGAKRTADTAFRFLAFDDGKIEWGDGSTRDTNLYRSAANMLKTDDHLTVGGTPASDGDTALVVNINLSSAISARRVVLGASDSGGAGFRMLRVVN